MAKASGKFSNLPVIVKRFERESTKALPLPKVLDILKSLPSEKMARAISGTGDKKSLEYKAAIRTVQRYKDGTRKPSKASLEKMNGIIKKFIKENVDLQEKFIGAVNFSLKGRVVYSSDKRNRTINVEMDRTNTGTFFDLAKADPDDLTEPEDFYFAVYMGAGENPGMYMEDYSACVISMVSAE